MSGAFIIQIPITGQFDGTTDLADSSLLTKVSDGLYVVTGAGGAAITNLGRIPLSFFLSKGLAARLGMFIPTVSHDGDSAVSRFTATRAVRSAAGALSWGGPLRLGDASAPGGAAVGPLALLSSSDTLVLTSDAAGDQVITLTLIPITPDRLVDTMLLAFRSDAVNQAIAFSGEIPDILSATGDAAQIPYNGPTITLDKLSLVASNTIGGANLVVTPTINGVGITSGTLTLTVGAPAGSIASATPTANNVLSDGDLLAFTVTGLGQTSAGHATVFASGRGLAA